MKTSNKLLIGLALVTFITIISLLIFAKSKIVTYEEYREQVKLSGNTIERVMTENLTTEDIEMGDNFEWILHPESTEVKVSGDEVVVSKLEISDRGQFRIRTGEVGSYEFGKITVHVGIKNLKRLKIKGEGNARISLTDAISLEDLNLRMNGNSRCTLNVSSPKIKLSSNGNSKITLLGSTENIDANINGNGKLYSEDLEVKDVTVYVNGNGGYYGGTVEEIRGSASGNGKISIKKATNSSNVSSSGNGRFTINSSAN